MNRLTEAAQRIKDTVSALEVGQALGFEIRRGRCRCPLHGGNDFNCVLYSGNRGFYCHVCKKGGDVISLVEQYRGSSFKDAVTWLNGAFGLGMDIDSPMDPEALRDAAERREMAQVKRQIHEMAERRRFDAALDTMELVRKLEEQRDRNVPESPDEEWKPAFCSAVRLLPYVRDIAKDKAYDCCERGEK